MLVIAVLFIYLFGGDVQIETAKVADEAACHQAVTQGITDAEKDTKVRGATGGCILVPIPPVRDKV